MRILLVDDDPDIRELAARAVRQEFPEAELVQAGRPGTVEELLAEPVDILVTDYMLRWSDGFVVQEAVKGRYPECCSVMFTGTGSEELAVRAMQAGFDDYVVKSPQQLRRLAAAVRFAYDRRQERQRLEEHRQLLLSELYHRLHNNLQIVIGLVKRTARALSDPSDREKLDDLSERIQAISMLQEEFYRARRIDAVPFADYLLRLARDHVALAANLELEAELEPITVSVQHAVPLALIANELLTNAIKHGFPDDRPGRLSIALFRDGDRAVMRIAEDGGGRGAGDAGAGKPSMGMELMSGLARQLEAQVRRDASAQGWSTSVIFTP